MAEKELEKVKKLEEEIMAKKDDYEAKRLAQIEVMKDKKAKIDPELMAHILNVWEMFYRTLDPTRAARPSDMQVAGYLTISYFLVGGKMPPEKFHELIMNIPLEDLEKK